MLDGVTGVFSYASEFLGDLSGLGSRARAGGADPCSPDAPMPVEFDPGNRQPPGAPRPPGAFGKCDGGEVPCQGGRKVNGVLVQSTPNRDDHADCVPLEHPTGSGRYWIYDGRQAGTREEARRVGKWREVELVNGSIREKGTASTVDTGEPSTGGGGVLDQLWGSIVQPGLDEIERRFQGATQGAAAGAQVGAETAGSGNRDQLMMVALVGVLGLAALVAVRRFS